MRLEQHKLREDYSPRILRHLSYEEDSIDHSYILVEDWKFEAGRYALVCYDWIKSIRTEVIQVTVTE